MRRKTANGFAFIMTVFVVLIAGSLVAGTVLLGSSHVIVNDHYDRKSELGWAADGALEWARSELNAHERLYPPRGYAILEDGVPVTDVDGHRLPGVRRWTFAGPQAPGVGSRSGGGSIVTIVRERAGGRVVRRQEVFRDASGRFTKGQYYRIDTPDFDVKRIFSSTSP